LLFSNIRWLFITLALREIIMCLKKHLILFLLIIFISIKGYSQKPTRIGTTAANFLEVGYGTAGNGMGDAYVSLSNDLSSAYWNPAGLAYMKQSEAMFVYQPWLVDVNSSFSAVGLVLPGIGTLAMSLISMDYGDMDVTTLAMQEGTGEQFSASDFAFSLSFGRKLVEWFAFGASAKYISSQIWHSNARAFAVDLGVVINTQFFSPSGDRKNGLNIGMSVSNYGTRMKYDGIDLINPIDIKPDEAGNFRDVPGQFRLQEWELPLIFRLGASITPVLLEHHQLLLAIDALHPNNNSESINLGAQYTFKSPTFGEVFLRGGYKALFMEDSEYGPSLGFGVVTHLLYNTGIKVEYAFRDVGVLGNAHSYSISVLF